MKICSFILQTCLTMKKNLYYVSNTLYNSSIEWFLSTQCHFKILVFYIILGGDQYLFEGIVHHDFYASSKGMKLWTHMGPRLYFEKVPRVQEVIGKGTAFISHYLNQTSLNQTSSSKAPVSYFRLRKWRCKSGFIYKLLFFWNFIYKFQGLGFMLGLPHRIWHPSL